MSEEIDRHDHVEKIGGDYKFVGFVVAAFHKLSGARRYVVEDDRGVLHINSFCHRCTRDEEFRKTGNGKVGCQIIADALFYGIEDPKYPKELVRDSNSSHGLICGEGSRCTAFEPVDEVGEPCSADFLLEIENR